ncbi:MAG: hypothetical protein IKZ88_04910 [Neisseriaceae bacterium]|nr:hypothetical protein [Neisseriaceae bacterium]
MTEIEELKFCEQANRCLRWALRELDEKVQSLYNQIGFFDEILQAIRKIDEKAVLSVIPRRLSAVILTNNVKHAKDALVLISPNEERFRVIDDGNAFWLVEDKFNRVVRIAERIEQDF